MTSFVFQAKGIAIYSYVASFWPALTVQPLELHNRFYSNRAASLLLSGHQKSTVSGPAGLGKPLPLAFSHLNN